jgi:hypothetical protein
VRVIGEGLRVGPEDDARAVGLGAGLGLAHVIDHKALAKLDAARLVLTEGLDLEELGQGVHRLDADAVEADGALECLAVVLRTRVDLRRAFQQLAQGHATSEVAHGDGLILGNVDLDRVAETHDVFVDAVVDDFLEQHINPVLRQRSVAELADVHPRAEPDVLAPVEGFDAVFSVIVRRSGSGHGR